MEQLLIQTIVQAPTWQLPILIALALPLLTYGADLLIDGVVVLAEQTGLPRVIIGATIVSIGTTLPEAFVSVVAAWEGNSGLALGNGVGSIIVDTGLILGLTAILQPTKVDRYLLKRTGTIQAAMPTLLVLISLADLWIHPDNPEFSRSWGLIFLVLLTLYIGLNFFWAKGMPTDIANGETTKQLPIWCNLLKIMIGLFLIIIGAKVLVPSAAELARRIGISEDIIAASMIAFGTSLPELVTAISAVKKGHPEIMVGNILGADVLNCLFVIGAAAAVHPLAIPSTFYHLHFPFLLLIIYTFRFSVQSKARLERSHGLILVLLYCLYLFLQFKLDLRPQAMAIQLPG